MLPDTKIRSLVRTHGIQFEDQHHILVPVQLGLICRQGVALRILRQGDFQLPAGLDGDLLRSGGKVVLRSCQADFIDSRVKRMKGLTMGCRYRSKGLLALLPDFISRCGGQQGHAAVALAGDGFVDHRNVGGLLGLLNRDWQAQIGCGVVGALCQNHIQGVGSGKCRVLTRIQHGTGFCYPIVVESTVRVIGGEVLGLGGGNRFAVGKLGGIVLVFQSARRLVNGQVEGGGRLHIVLGRRGCGSDPGFTRPADGHCAVCAHRGNGGVTAGIGDLAVPGGMVQGVDEGAVPVSLGDGSLGKGQGLGNGADGDGELRNRTQGVVILVLAGQGSRVGNRLVLAGIRRCDGSSIHLCPQVISLCLLVEGHGSLGDRHGGLVRPIVPVLGGEAAGDIHDSGGNGHGKGLALQDIAAAVHHRKEPVCPHRELAVQGAGQAGAHRCAAVLRPQLVPLYGDTGLDLLGLGPHPQAEDHIAAAVHLPHVILGGDLFLIGVGTQLADDLYTGKGGGGHTDVAQILLVIIVSIILIRLHLVWIGLIRCILEHLPGSQHVLEVVKGHVP